MADLTQAPNDRSVLSKIPQMVKRVGRFLSNVGIPSDAPPEPKRQVLTPDFISVPTIGKSPLIFDPAALSAYQATVAGVNAEKTDPDTKAAIRRTASKATMPNSEGKPFELVVDPETDSDGVVSAVLESMMIAPQIAIYARAKRFIRHAMMEGSAYFKIDVDPTLMRIVSLKKIPGPESGFFVIGPIQHEDDQLNGGYMHIEKASGKMVNFFHGYQVIPFHQDVDENTQQGIPISDATHDALGRELGGAQALGSARLGKAWTRRVFKYEGINQDKVDEIAAKHDSRLKALGKSQVFKDIHTTAKDVEVQDESSPAQYNIDDIRYHQSQKRNGLSLPTFLYAGETKAVPNKSLGEVLFDEWIQNEVKDAEAVLVGDWEHSGLKKMVGIQLDLIGRMWWNTDVTFKFPNKRRVVTAEVQAHREVFKTGTMSYATYHALLSGTEFEVETARRKDEELSLLDMRSEIEEKERKLFGDENQGLENGNDRPREKKISGLVVGRSSQTGKKSTSNGAV